MASSSTFSLLFIGDVVGRSGRDAVAAHLPGLIAEHAPELVILNGENSAHGFGITPAICRQFFDLGVDVITTGNHVWDQKEILGFIDSEPRLLRPLNYPKGTPGHGAYLAAGRTGKRVLVANVMLRLFMDAMDDPFAGIDKILTQAPLGGAVDAIFVDVHGEATSEKMAMGHHLDGRVTAVVGTHTHVPTADHHVLAGGTAYQSDAGMTGDYRSVIGMKAEPALYRFTRKLPSERLTPAEGEGTLCGCLVRVRGDGKALAIEPARLGGALAAVRPPRTRGISGRPVQEEAAHIFVVDDDRRLADLLCRYLTNAGYVAMAAHNVAEARAKLASLTFDLVVLDIMMPGESGLVLAEELVAGAGGPPVLLITALDAPEDRVNGLSAGAEDYIAKPFDPRELLLRIERILRRRDQVAAEPQRAGVEEPERLALGPYVLDIDAGLLWLNDKRIPLTPQEQRLLRFLAKRLGDEVSRDDLVEALGEGTTWRAVDVQIARLRKKLEPDPRNPNWLQTVRGVGYRLTGRPLA